MALLFPLAAFSELRGRDSKTERKCALQAVCVCARICVHVLEGTDGILLVPEVLKEKDECAERKLAGCFNEGRYWLSGCTQSHIFTASQ